MVRFGSHKTCSPSEVFSSDIPQTDDKPHKKRSSTFKWFAIIAAVLCVLFVTTTIVLAIILRIKLHEEEVAVQNCNPIGVVQEPGMAPSGRLNWPPPSGSLHAQFKRAALASDNGLCSEIGRDVFLEGGNAIEGAIAALLCIGVVNPQSSGIGGGLIMTIYNVTTQRCTTLDAREVAPLSATSTMYAKSPQDSGIGYKAIATPGEIHGLWTAFQRFGSGRVSWKRLFLPSIRLAREGFPVSSNLALVLQLRKVAIEADKDMNITNNKKAIATPGEIHGLWTAFQRFGSGRVSWKRLFLPSIRLAREGFPVSSNLALVLKLRKVAIEADKDMKSTFVDTRTGRVYEEGDIMKRERLAQLLDELAAAPDPVQLFYKEGIAQTIAEEMKEKGGYVTAEDLSSYETIVHEQPLNSEVLPGEMTMCGPPPPSSFAVIQAIVGIMAHFYSNKHVDLDDPLVYHRLIEAEKFAYAYRTKLGDAAFVKNARQIAENMTKPAFIKWISSLIKDEAQPLQYYTKDLTGHVPDHGTSHVTAHDQDGNAVSVTSTVNYILGANRVSPTLGIIWNDEMNDFSMPNSSNVSGFAPSPENFILPRKRPMSSMSPTIIYNRNSGKVKMVVGASGGSKIISAVAQTIVRTLVFNQTVKEAVDAPRFHNQFLPHITEYEHTVPQSIIKNLVNQRHQKMMSVEKQSSVVQALVAMDDSFIHGNSDFRRKTASYPAGY